ncbi:MAG: O-antigen ligase family protein [Planctomycetota bacterium]|jgi:O-antigen ligase
MIVIHPSLYIVAVLVICALAWVDWFKGLCGLIMLTAFASNPAFPAVAGRQAFNLWNITFANVSLAWLCSRRREGLYWDMPRKISVFLLLWLGVLVLGWARLALDISRLPGYTLLEVASDDLIDAVKWPSVGLLAYDGCRSRHRVKMFLVCVILMFALFAVQMAHTVPPRTVTRGGLEETQTRYKLKKELGVSPNGAAKMMSGVPWAALAVASFLERRKSKCIMYAVSAMSLYALALTGGRAGYLACGATLVFLCFVRWRRQLLLVPLLLLIIPVVLPGATKRMFEGFNQATVSGDKRDNIHDISAGRTEIWAVVIPKIFESPVLGFGRRAMPRIGLQQSLLNTYGEEANMAVAHPHNAYLEILLESGLNGFVIIVALHTLILVYSIRTFVAREDPMLMAVGGVALSLLTGHMVANMGGQSFYPRAIDVGLWAAVGVMLRCYVTMKLSACRAEQSASCDMYCRTLQSPGHAEAY